MLSPNKVSQGWHTQPLSTVHQGALSREGFSISRFFFFFFFGWRLCHESMTNTSDSVLLQIPDGVFFSPGVCAREAYLS